MSYRTHIVELRFIGDVALIRSWQTLRQAINRHASFTACIVVPCRSIPQSTISCRYSTEVDRGQRQAVLDDCWLPRGVAGDRKVRVSRCAGPVHCSTVRRRPVDFTLSSSSSSSLPVQYVSSVDIAFVFPVPAR